jgi:hypothetical protein
MGTIAAQILIDAVARTLQDPTNIKWGRGELLEYLNDGQREIVLAKPDSYVKNESLALVAGTKQTIPAGGIVFMRINRNMGLTGATPGRVVRHVKINILDEQIPDWHSATPAAAALHYTFDEQDPKRFYVYPPQPLVPNQVEVVYSAAPPDVADEADAITLDDVYKTPLVKYMEYRAYSKDADYAREDGAAQAAYGIFGTLVGLKERADAAQQAKR